MKILVIGAGASGLMYTHFAKENLDNQIIIVEKNEKVGKKLYITGKGRCNVTNYKEPQDFLDNVRRNKDFLKSAIYSFTPFDAFNLLSEKQELKVERGDRVFPSSDKSSDIIKALYELSLGKNVSLHLNEEVLDIEKVENTFLVKTNKDQYIFDKVVVATGGISYPQTGSTGDGYKFAKKFGHKIEDLVPSLCAIFLKEDTLPYKGITLKNIKLTVVDENNNEVYKEQGELLFTHKGVSGPLAFRASSYINRKPNLSKYKIYIDLKPALDEKTLDNRILRDFQENKNKQVKNALKGLLLNAFIPLILQRSKINENKEENLITKEERKNLIKNIKNLEFSIKALDDITRSIVTSGGVSVKEINPKNMQSKLVDNLYFIGEVLDIDALTGGYSIQIAFSTAYKAAKEVL